VNLLFNNFNSLSDALNSISKLRELILQLAVSGKLVPQDSNDEPASELLKRIKIEKEKLIKEKKIKKEKLLPVNTENENLFKLPKDWKWVSLNEICKQITDGTHYTPTYVSKGIPFLSVKDVSSGYLDFRNTKYISIEEHKKLIQRSKPELGDIILTKVGTTGIAIVVNQSVDFSIFVSLALLKPFINYLNSSYLSLVINSPFVKKMSKEGTEGIGNKNLVLRKIKNFKIPIPPLNEQKRIVAKVDQLMALCDELEKQQEKRNRRCISLNNSALNELLTSQKKEEFGENWQRIAGNFDLLYNVPENVAQLKQAILQLAVQGKLVLQNPNDEPAIKLLKRIKAEKERLIKEGNIKKEKPLPAISEDEIHYKLPNGWVWVRFGQVTINRDGDRIPVSREERQNRYGPYDYYGASGVIDKIDGFIFNKPLLLIGEDGANLINRSTPIAFIAYGKYWVNNHAHVLDSINFEIMEFIELHINAIDLKPYVTGTAQPKMNQAKMNSILIAFPPEDEQKRIVAKVNELIKLCDKLETQLEQSQQQSEKLMEAVVQSVISYF
jgi:type I restriction enzyme, S subunit